MDKNFWKDRYKDSWDKAAQKEKMVVELIESRSGKTVEIVGLGAGTSDYLSGSAADNNSVKGDADLFIKEANIFIEVTGPNIKVNVSDALWIRPDKIQNALTKMEKGIGTAHYVIHVIESKIDGQTIIRVIPITNRLNIFPVINPRIRGTVETYREIPSNYEGIITFDQFISNLSQ